MTDLTQLTQAEGLRQAVTSPLPQGRTSGSLYWQLPVWPTVSWSMVDYAVRGNWPTTLRLQPARPRFARSTQGDRVAFGSPTTARRLRKGWWSGPSSTGRRHRDRRSVWCDRRGPHDGLLVGHDAQVVLTIPSWQWTGDRAATVHDAGHHTSAGGRPNWRPPLSRSKRWARRAAQHGRPCGWGVVAQCIRGPIRGQRVLPRARSTANGAVFGPVRSVG